MAEGRGQAARAVAPLLRACHERRGEYPPRPAMYSTHEIFAKMPASTSAQLLSHISEKEKPLMKATIEKIGRAHV